METRGEKMLALRRSRMAAAPAILRGGFRPFFFAGPLWAVVALACWLFALAGHLSIPSAFDALAWHRHEMLFGFVGAVIAGFLLTAIPNWTGRLPIAGMPLAALVGLWLAGRLANLMSLHSGQVLAAALDVGFFLVLAGLAGREVLAANNRNLPAVGVVFLLGIANGFDHLSTGTILAGSSFGWQLAVSLVIVLITLIGGRIIPSFTRNWLAKQGVTCGLPGQPDRKDMIAIGVTSFALLAWIIGPAGWLPGSLLLLAALAQLFRLARWKGWKTWPDPLVIILHVGFAWVPIGLALLGLSQLGQLPQSVAIHALTAGAMSTMILAVMTRATLGHTGRDLRAGWATTLSYVLVTAGAVVRVTAPLVAPDYRTAMEAAGVLWILAFIVFLFAYGPILFARRLGETA